MNDAQRRALRADLLDELDQDFHLTMAHMPNDHINIEHSLYAVHRALDEWRSNILEPQGTVKEHRILDYIHEGSKWSWIEEYTNRKLAWCGHFLAYCYADIIKDSIRKKCFPSTYRLRQWAQGTDREIESIESARAGDILIVGRKKSYGDHITLIEKIEDDLSGVWTVEGNAFGETPQASSRKEGVIRRFRAVKDIRFIYRPLEQDRHG